MKTLNKKDIYYLVKIAEYMGETVNDGISDLNCFKSNIERQKIYDKCRNKILIAYCIADRLFGPGSLLHYVSELDNRLDFAYNFLKDTDESEMPC